MDLRDVKTYMMNTSEIVTTPVDTIILNTSDLEHCHSFDTNESITFYVNVVALAIIILFGLVGNSIVTFVYTIDKVKNSSGTLLIALSILDNILLLSALFSDVLHSVFPYTGSGHWLWDNQGYFLIMASPISKWAHTCSTWCIILLTVDRYIAVSKPLKAAKICTVRRARLYIVILVAVAFLYNLPKAFEYTLELTVEECSNQTIWRRVETNLMTNKIYQLGYTVVLYFILIYIIPLAILIILNALLIKLIKSATIKRRVLTNKPKLTRKSSSLRQMLVEDGVTRTIVCIIARFIICATPALAFQILVLIDNPVKDTYQVFSNLLIYLNSSTNFIIFSVMGRRFRHILFTRICRSKSSQLKKIIQAHRINSNMSNFSIATSSRLSMSNTETISVASGVDTYNDITRMSTVQEVNEEEGATPFLNKKRRNTLPHVLTDAVHKINSVSRQRRYSLDNSTSKLDKFCDPDSRSSSPTTVRPFSNCCLPAFPSICDNLKQLKRHKSSKIVGVKFYLDDNKI